MEVNSDPNAGSLASLTRREREVVTAIGDGRSTHEIAQHLGVSVRTVESHVWNAFRKLGVHNRVELVRWLLRHDAINFDS